MILAGKRILVTGGSSGIGLALAERLAARGASVAVSGRRRDVVSSALERLRRPGIDVYGIVADVATTAGRAATLEGALKALGGLDVLVNNAGGVRAGPLEAMTEVEIQAMIDVNLLAPILLTRAALPALRRGGDSLVVNIASGAALVGIPFYATYAATKAGLARFGEAMRRELRDGGVHVITVYPGATDTPMMSTSKAGPELGFARESAATVGDAILEGMENDALEVIRGGPVRAAMIARNQQDPAALDQRFLDIREALAEAVGEHSAL